MSDADASAVFLSCIECLRSGPQEHIPMADQKLQELISNEAAVEPLFKIAMTNPNEDVRYYAVVLVGRMVSSKTLSLGTIPATKGALITLVRNETCDKVVCFALGISCDISEQYKESGGFPELIALVVELTQQPDRINLCLTAWSLLIQTGNLTSDVLNGVLEGLTHGLATCLVSGNTRMMGGALTALDAIVKSHLVSGLFAKVPQLVEALMNSARIALEVGDDQTVYFAFAVIYSIMTESEEDLRGAYEFLYRLVETVIGNTALSYAKRQNSLLFFAGLAIVQPNLIEEKVPDIVQANIMMLVQQCTASPDAFEPAYGTDILLRDFAEVEEFREVVFWVVMDFATAPWTNEIHGRVALTCLMGIAHECAEVIDENHDAISGVVANALASTSECLHGDMCSFLKVLSDVCPMSFSSKFVDVVKTLIVRHGHPDSLFALREVLRCCEEWQGNPGEVIGGLVAILTPDNASIVIPCISEVVSNVKGIDEALYTGIREVIVKLLQSEVAREQVYECFGRCVNIAPRLVASELPSICSAMGTDLGNDLGPESVSLIAGTMGSFAVVIPNAIKPFMSSFFAHFAKIVASGVTSDENDEEGAIDAMVGDALISMAAMASADPEQLTGAATATLNVIMEWMGSDDETKVGMAASALEKLNKGMAVLSCPVDPVIIQLVRLLNNADDLEVEQFKDLLNALACTLEENGATISAQVAQSVNDLLVDCLKLWSVAFNCQANLGYAIQGYILGGAFERCPNAGGLVSALTDQVTGKKKKQMQSYAIASMARMCFVAPAPMTASAPTLITFILQVLSRKITEQRKNTMYCALMYLLVSHRECFTPEQVGAIARDCAQVVAHSEGILKGTSAVVWLVLCVFWGVESTPELMAGVLNVMPPHVDDEGMPIYSSCLAALNRREAPAVTENLQRLVPPIVATLTAYTKRIPREEWTQWVTVVNSMSDEWCIQFLEWNEAHLGQMRRNALH